MDKPRLQQIIEKKVVPAIKEQLGLTNVNAVPKLKKVALNVGLKNGIKDAKFIDAVERTLTRITGQKPVKTLAKKSISNFKIREGNLVGMMVTLRGRRMYDFVDKLINVTLPRISDFRGLTTKSIDHAGNLSIGFREIIAFPEIRPEDTDIPHGLEVTIVTDADTKEAGEALLAAIGVPFKEHMNT